ncbi:MAG TPA: PPC domain-containing protein [Gemmatimonadaceae bacterium]|nr:PPC domain-containing protein [Gemmatimonadaceae bacterium]
MTKLPKHSKDWLNRQGPAPPTSWSGLDVSGMVAKAVEQRWATPTLPAGAYEFTLSGTEGDADLYVRRHHPPTTTTYDCRPYKNGSNEICVVNLAGPAVVHVMVRGYAISSTFRLEGKKK